MRMGLNPGGWSTHKHGLSPGTMPSAPCNNVTEPPNCCNSCCALGVRAPDGRPVKAHVQTLAPEPMSSHTRCGGQCSGGDRMPPTALEHMDPGRLWQQAILSLRFTDDISRAVAFSVKDSAEPFFETTRVPNFIAEHLRILERGC